MATATEITLFRPSHTSLAKIPILLNVGHFTIKTIDHLDDLIVAYSLRAQVFQLEMMGQEKTDGLDTDSFDLHADHLAIIDNRTEQMVATCRLICSTFTNKFYSEQEFNFRSLLERPEIKLELGRVCVHPNFRRGAILLMLWRAIGQYMLKSGAEILFGCGSVMTQDPRETAIVFRHLHALGKVQLLPNFSPTEKYRFLDFEAAMKGEFETPLTLAESTLAQELLPPLCQSYFEIGCYIPGAPAIDREFKCIDFLTVLERKQLDPRLRKKLLGEG